MMVSVLSCGLTDTNFVYADTEDETIDMPIGEFDNEVLPMDEEPKINAYVSTPRNSSVLVWTYVDRMTTTQISAYHDEAARLYPNAIRLASATNYYNCHSYAWYSQNVNTNQYWMEDPSLYITDGSYCRVSGNPQAGDIIVYYDDYGIGHWNENDETSDGWNDDRIMHSGIVTAFNNGISNGLCGNSDLVTVTSKWGAGGLYSHNGYECPYTGYKPHNEEADYVRYYRPHAYFYQGTGLQDSHRKVCGVCHDILVEPHIFNSYTNKGLTIGHEGTCAGCGETYLLAHNWTTFPSYYKCSGCGLTSEYIPVITSSLPPEIQALIANNEGKSEFAIQIDENTVLCCIDSQYYYVKAETSETATLMLKNAVYREEDNLRS